ncbi:hypothetical protein OAU50_06555 [Planctomycetota bacterium]|nr:hypothetical protein [Planctomycetota bacterium]
MNQWDREQHMQPHSASGGIAWLISVVIAVIGLIALSKGAGHGAVTVPIFISVFFMVLYLFSHRREYKRIASAQKEAKIMQQANIIAAESKAYINKQRDKELRRVFDRFDLMVIGNQRSQTRTASAVAEVLEFARDYVDSSHAIDLLKKEQFKELDIHLNAAYERAVLQLELSRTV